MLELRCRLATCLVFFFNDTATTEIYTLSLHDALPILLNLLSNTDCLFYKRHARKLMRAYRSKYDFLSSAPNAIFSSLLSSSYCIYVPSYLTQLTQLTLLVQLTHLTQLTQLTQPVKPTY